MKIPTLVVRQFDDDDFRAPQPPPHLFFNDGTKVVGRGLTIGNIVSIVISGVIIILFLVAIIFFFIRRRRGGRKGKRRAVPHTRSASGYMGSAPAMQMSQKSGGGLSEKASKFMPTVPGFLKFGKRSKSSDAGGNVSYANLGQPPPTPHADEQMIGPSPPGTPATAYGWNSGGQGGQGGSSVRRDSLAVPEYRSDTGYRGGSTGSESDEYLPKYTPPASSTESSVAGNGVRRDSSQFKRSSGAYNAYQSKPEYDPFDEEKDQDIADSRRGY